MRKEEWYKNEKNERKEGQRKRCEERINVWMNRRKIMKEKMKDKGVKKGWKKKIVWRFEEKQRKNKARKKKNVKKKEWNKI